MATLGHCLISYLFLFICCILTVHGQDTLLFVAPPTLFEHEVEPYLLLAREYLVKQADAKIFFAASKNFESLVKSSNTKIHFVDYHVETESLLSQTQNATQAIQTYMVENGAASQHIVKESSILADRIHHFYYENMFRALKEVFMQHSIQLVVVHPSVTVVRDLSLAFRVPSVILATSLTSLPGQPYYVPWEGSGIGLQASTLDRLRMAWKVLQEVLKESDENTKLKNLRQQLLAEEGEPDMNQNDALLSPLIYPTLIGFEYSFPVESFVHFVGPLLYGQQESPVDEVQKFVTSHANIILVDAGYDCIVHDAQVYQEMKIAFEKLAKEYAVLILLPPKQACESVHDTLQATFASGHFASSSIALRQYLLSHANVKLLISNGDFQVVQLAVHFAKPSILLPLHYDQFDVAARAEDARVAIVLKESKTSTLITEAIRTLLSTSKSNIYKKHAQKLQTIFARAHANEKSLELLQDTLAMHGISHMTPVWLQLPFWRVYSVDLAFFIFILPFLASCCMMFALCFKYMDCCAERNKLKIN